MLIGELAQATGLSSHAIRFYEKKGLLAKRYIQRGSNNYRQYPREAIQRVREIQTLHAAGFTLSEIKDLLDQWDSGRMTPEDGVKLLRQKMDDIDAKISDLKQIKKTFFGRKLGEHIKQKTNRHPPPEER